MEEGVLNRGWWSTAAAALMLSSSLGLGCGPRTGDAAPRVLDAPALQQRVAGSTGHPLLVVFWATWCQPCVAEMPDMVALDQESPGGLRILAVSLDFFLSGKSTEKVVGDYLHAHPAPLEHVIYSGSQDAIFSAFEMPGNIPYSILYDSQGHVLKRFTGQAAPADVRAALAASPG